jgi:hypothetical protein
VKEVLVWQQQEQLLLVQLLVWQQLESLLLVGF